jgi:hypothetical protein
MSETTASALPATRDFLCARLNAARTSPESFDLDGLLGEAVTALGRWDALKAQLRTEAAGWRKESREWKDDSPNQRQFAGMARMAELTVAKMTEMEEGR